MTEKLNHNKPVLAISAVIASLALAGCSTTNKTVSNERSTCTAVGFGADRGGPGEIAMDVFAILKNGEVASDITGEVIAGNDTGEAVVNSVVFTDAGTFKLTFDPNSVAIQTSEVSISALVPGMSQLQECPDTTLHYDPSNGNTTPTYK
jgi:hypothetical protein